MVSSITQTIATAVNAVIKQIDGAWERIIGQGRDVAKEATIAPDGWWPARAVTSRRFALRSRRRTSTIAPAAAAA
jgi:hypothetical protein